MTAKEKILQLIDDEIEYLSEYSDKEWAENTLSELQKLKQIVEGLEDGIEEYIDKHLWDRDARLYEQGAQHIINKLKTEL